MPVFAWEHEMTLFLSEAMSEKVKVPKDSKLAHRDQKIKIVTKVIKYTLNFFIYLLNTQPVSHSIL